LIAGKRKYLLVALLGIFIVAGTLGGIMYLRTRPLDTSPKGTSPPTTTNTPPKVDASYTWQYKASLDNIQPPAGSRFLIIHLTLINKGYSSFTTNLRLDLYVLIAGQRYNVSDASFFLLAGFGYVHPTSLGNGEQVSVDVPFIVPDNLNTAPEVRLAAAPGYDVKIQVVGSV
jgi:hypothetical protein